jgi:hypothetical protein
MQTYLKQWRKTSNSKSKIVHSSLSNKSTLNDNNDFQSLCAVIGFIEIHWAQFEQGLDLITEIAYRDLGGAALHNRLPTGYSEKSCFLRKAFSKLIVLKSLNKEIIQILDISDGLAKKRNDLTHGAVTHLDSKDGVFHFSKIDSVKSEHSYRSFLFDLADFPELTKELLDLCVRKNNLAVKVEELKQGLNKSSLLKR